MGNRANFIVKQKSGDFLCVYGHWAGEGMFAQLANAIGRVILAGRQHDESYANRIFISELVGNDWMSDLGWGVSINSLPDNEHHIPVVDFNGGTVALYDSPLGSFGGGTFDPAEFIEPRFVMPLDVFVKKYAKSLTSV